MKPLFRCFCQEDRSGPVPLPVSVPSAAPGMMRSKAPRGPPIRAENVATSCRVFFSTVVGKIVNPSIPKGAIFHIGKKMLLASYGTCIKPFSYYNVS